MQMTWHWRQELRRKRNIYWTALIDMWRKNNNTYLEIETYCVKKRKKE